MFEEGRLLLAINTGHIHVIRREILIFVFKTEKLVR